MECTRITETYLDLSENAYVYRSIHWMLMRLYRAQYPLYLDVGTRHPDMISRMHLRESRTLHKLSYTV